MDKSAAQALAYWLIGGIAIAAIAQVIPGLIPPLPGSDAEAIVRAFAHTGIAALAAWMVARRRPSLGRGANSAAFISSSFSRSH